MKKVSKFSILALILLFLGSSSMNAQTRRTTKPKEKTQKSDKYFDESGGFAHKLWYGGGVNLGFQGGTNSSQFNVGLSPMVGYKITPELSVGPRFSFVYNSYKFGGTDGASWTDYSAGVFARYKFLQTFFLQTEYQYANQVIDLGYDRATNSILLIRSSRDNTYIGAGYNSGGLFGYEIAILYNVNVPANSFQSPLDIRAGFTYNF